MIQRICGRLTGHWWDRRGPRPWAEQHQVTTWQGLRSFARDRCRLCGYIGPQQTNLLRYVDWEDQPS